jgi:hypothetical protein
MSGTSSSTQNQSSSVAPYSAASTGLNGILGSLSGMTGSAGSLNSGQTGSLSQITANANATPSNTGVINSGTLGLLNGGGANNNNGAISSNLGTLNSQLGTMANGGDIGNNSALTPELNAINTGVQNSVNSQFAAAGRSGSPANSMALGMGIAQGDAPVIANQYNTDTANQMAAANDLYGAGNSTYGLLNADQTQANTNFTNGIAAEANGTTAEDAAPNAALTAANDQFGIPASQLQTLLGSISPVAAQFGTQTGSSSGTQTMSPVQQLALLMSGAGGMFKGGVGFGAAPAAAPAASTAFGS